MEITDKEYEELVHKITRLQNRCFVLSQGMLCEFCPYTDCKNRPKKEEADKT